MEDTKNQTNSGDVSVDTQQNVLKANEVGSKSRDDIYKRFFNQTSSESKELSDSSSAKEESVSEPDSKLASDSEQHSDTVLEPTEKPTSEKKGKEPKEDEPKTVPLQALHEARERFRKINLEYREYKQTQDKEITELKSQLKQLQDKLNSPTEDSYSNDDEEKQALRLELAALRKKYNLDDESKMREAQIKAQQEQQKKITQVSEDLLKEGYPGFDIALLKTGTKLQELVQSGEITESESAEPDMWKKIYKEHIYPEVKSIFVERTREDMKEHKKALKKKANLVSDPGKGPEKTEEPEEDVPSYNDFVKSQMNKRMDEYKKKFYKR